MKVRLIKRKTIEIYCVRNSASRSAFEAWLDKIKNADWNKTNDIKDTFSTADFLGKSSERIVFNIGGNKYRLICSYFFGDKNVHLFINWIGTHAEYDKICSDSLQYKIKLY